MPQSLWYVFYAGDSVDESKALGRTEFIVGTLNAGNHYFKMRLDDIPNDMTQITAAVDFTTNAGARKTETRTYDLPATILNTRKGMLCAMWRTQAAISRWQPQAWMT